MKDITVLGRTTTAITAMITIITMKCGQEQADGGTC